MDTNTSNKLKWTLAGIQADRQNTQAYLKHLDEQEALVRDQLTGTAAVPSKGRVGRPKGAANKASQPKTQRTRKRVLSPEARENMRQAQQRRWSKIRGTGESVTTAQTAQAAAAPQPPLGEVPQTIQ